VAQGRRILIFDLDGTLVDTMAPSADLFCEMLSRELRVPEHVSRPLFTRLMGRGPKAQFDAVLRQVGSWDAALVEDITKRYWEADEANTPALFPDVLDALHGLRQDGYTMVISSGSIPTSVQRKTRVSGIDSLFRLALGSDEDVPGLAKGAGHFAMIAEALSLTPSELSDAGVFIGDGVYDMQLARAAKMLAVGRLTGDNADVLVQAGAHRVISELHELRSLLLTR
jgi:phosphoglycolate phosphatase-like HAD superfamily hydrolase